MPLGSDDHLILDPARRRLLRNGEPVALGDRAFDLLLALAGAGGRPVPAGVLVARVWPGITVGDGNLRVQVRALRRALGDGAVETVPGVGYRLALPLAAAGEGAPAAPPGAGDLVGRGEARDRLRDMLARSRLVSVVGPGGVGKTALALATARDRGDTRVAHVELAPLRQPGLVAVATAAALSAKLLGPDVLAAIRAALGGQETLLVLDNAEHLLDEVRAFADGLLGECPEVRLLVTSREPLNIAGELQFHLCPLESPPHGDLPPAEIRAYPAVRLVLRNHAEAGWPPPGDAELPTLARLCRQLDGLPLALVLLAGQLRDCRLEDVARTLEGRFRDLPLPDAAGYRHGSLARMLDWSLELLSAEERLLLGRLTVFAGAWTVDAAVEVCGQPPLHPAAVPGLVAGLVARSLVAGPLQTRQPGLRLLETIRQDVAARDPDLPAREGLHARLAGWLSRQLRRVEAAARLDGEPDPSLEVDIATILPAIDWCLDGGDIGLGQRLAVDAIWLYRRAGLFVQIADRLVRAWEARGPDTPPATRAMLGLLVHGEGASTRLPHHADRPRYAREELAPALDALRAADIPAPWMVEALSSAGWLCRYVGDLDGQVALWMEGAALADRHGYQRDRLRFLSLVGGAEANRGDLPTARRRFDEALAVVARWDLDAGLTLMRLADMEFVAGDIPRAIAVAREALATDRPMLPALRQTLHANLASYLLVSGRLAEAAPEALAALRLTLRYQYSYAHAWTLERGALMALRLGRRELAGQLAALGDSLVRAGHLVRYGPERAVRRFLDEELARPAPGGDLPPVEQALGLLAGLYGDRLADRVPG